MWPILKKLLEKIDFPLFGILPLSNKIIYHVKRIHEVLLLKLFVDWETFDLVCRGPPYEILVLLTNEMIMRGKKRTALFLTHNWKRSSFFNTLTTKYLENQPQNILTTHHRTSWQPTTNNLDNQIENILTTHHRTAWQRTTNNLGNSKENSHTWYLLREPREYLCKFFLAGVNFYRFNAKNWHFRQILREKVAFFCRFNAKNWRFSV